MNRGSVHQLSFYSRHLNKEKKIYLYLPPSYAHREDLHYSCLYSLPGLLDYEATWCEKGRIHEAMDLLIHHRSLGEMIIVMPDKDDSATNAGDEYYFGHYLATDLVEFMESNFRVIPSPEHRGVEGLSLGASWAVRLAIQLPGRFRSVGLLSTAFGEDDYAILEENLEPLLANRTRFFFAVGTQEAQIIPSNQHFCTFVQELGLDAHFILEEGPHDWPLWQKVIYQSLPFHYRSFNL